MRGVAEYGVSELGVPFCWDIGLNIGLGFCKMRSTFVGGPHNTDDNILRSILGFPILGNYHIGVYKRTQGHTGVHRDI